MGLFYVACVSFSHAPVFPPFLTLGTFMIALLMSFESIIYIISGSLPINEFSCFYT